MTEPIRFPFAQFEFSHNIGPPPGRYVVRPEVAGTGGVVRPLLRAPAALEPGEDPRLGANDVILIEVDGASQARGRRFSRRPRHARADAPPRDVPIVVATVIRSTGMLRRAEEAVAFLADLRDSADEREAWVVDGLALLNRAVAAYRMCAADPYAIDLARADAREVRIGYGTADDVKHGGWEDAIGVAPPAAPHVARALRLMPTQGMAAVLGGRARTLEAEELILRAVLDVRHGRGRAAAICLRGAHELLADELRDEALDAATRRCLEAVQDTRGAVAELAAAAGHRSLTADEVERVRTHAETAGALVDAWRYQAGEHARTA